MGLGVSEEIIAEALHPYPTGLVIATKGGFVRPVPTNGLKMGNQNTWDPPAKGLRRLCLDRIDLYQLHRIDPKVPAEDQLGTLRDLQAQGKIKHIGLSEVSVRQIQHARTIVPIVSVQNRYSVTDRGSEDVLEYCEKEKMGFIPWFPPGGRSCFRFWESDQSYSSAMESYPMTVGSGMAASSISSHTADPRNFQGRTSRRKCRGSGIKDWRKQNAWIRPYDACQLGKRS
jgi:aryl-alcohol dehydrogenase-like predicted oxidoreductase